MRLAYEKSVLHMVAQKHQVPVAMVKRDIMQLWEKGRTDPRQEIRTFWNAIPHRKKKPSAEELIHFLTTKLQPKDKAEKLISAIEKNTSFEF